MIDACSFSYREDGPQEAEEGDAADQVVNPSQVLVAGTKCPVIICSSREALRLSSHQHSVIQASSNSSTIDVLDTLL